MEKKITFVGLEHSPVLDNHIVEQLKKVEHLLEEENGPIFFEFLVEFHERHERHCKVSARLKTPHYECYAEHEGPDVYVEINEVADRLLKQLRTAKQKLVDVHQRGCGKECRANLMREAEQKNEGEGENEE